MAAQKPMSFSFVRSISATAVSCAVLSIALSSGCSSLVPNVQRDTEFAQNESNLPTYKVIFASSMGGEPTVFTGHISGQMTVHDALVESGAVDKFKGMKIDLARRVPDRADILRMEINYDAEERHVVENWNYAIHPGDEILVRKEDVGPLATVFKSLGG